MRIPTEPIPLANLLAHCTSDAAVRFDLERQWVQAKIAWEEWQSVERSMFVESVMPAKRNASPVVADDDTERLESVTRRHVAAMLEKYPTTNVAAAVLGISPATIYRMKLKAV